MDTTTNQPQKSTAGHDKRPYASSGSPDVDMSTKKKLHSGNGDHAYLLVFPCPGKGAFGIERDSKPEDALGKYVFWVKIGDCGDDPNTRLNFYQQWIINQDVAFCDFTCCYPDPTNRKPRIGKQLEHKIFGKSEMGGLGQARSSEWRAVYSSTKSEDFGKLSDSLAKLVKGVNERQGGCEYDFGEFHQLVTKAIQDGHGCLGPASKPGEAPTADKPRWVYIMTIPSVHKNAKNMGISKNGEHIVSVRVGTFYYDTSHPFHWFSRQGPMTHIPDFAYNAAEVPPEKTSNNDELAKLIAEQIKSGIHASTIKMEDFDKQGYKFTVNIGSDTNSVRKQMEFLRETVDNFHNWYNHK
ncbi:hypothetical protein CTheo_8301 [Ceratobasidium theobromae]|uniref:Uncharacterized protein n=1 Tax=Ceratobasidium theobromae TaxID=1582974 RepID=A0A5N5Q8Z2_9AGAM|nr:hypothetical protein CTheo_8301 [Ceratobasidium theobromae]